MKKSLNIRKPRYSEYIWSVPWPFIISSTSFTFPRHFSLIAQQNFVVFVIFAFLWWFSQFSLFRRGPSLTSFTFPLHFSCMALQNFVIFVIVQFFSSCRNFRCFVEGLSRPHLHFLVTFRPWPYKIS